MSTVAGNGIPEQENPHKSDDEDEMLDEPSLARSGRRASISMPTGLDLLVKLAEYTWQAKPPINSSFDDLAEAGVADASPHSPRTPTDGKSGGAPGRRRVGVQSNIPGRHPGPPGATKTGIYEEDSEDDPGSELSEPDLPTKNPRVNLNPAGVNGKSSNGRAKLAKQVRVQSSDDDEEDEFTAALRPLSSRRKGSIAPLRIPNSAFNQSNPSTNGAISTGGGGDEEKGSAASPTPSATSLSSLLREKLGHVPIPGMFRNRKPKEYRLQAFVAILFLTIIVLVGSIYIIHKEKELQKSYFDRIRFSSKDRRIRVTNILDKVVLSGMLGVNLNARDKAWPCLTENQRENETCLEWMGKGRLYLKTKAPPPKGQLPGVSATSTHANVLCYGIYWEGLSNSFPLKDCYDMGETRGGFFYGGGEMEKDQWPLNKTIVPYSPYLTGKKIDYKGDDKNGGTFQWGRSLRRYFVNSEGAAVQITDESPLYVSINHPKKDQLCFGAVNDGFGFADWKTTVRFPFLNYTICTAENALEISKGLADKDIWKQLRHEDAQMSYFLATHPIWRVRPEILDQGNRSDHALLNYTDKISAIFPSEGFILLDESWQEKIGDLEGDPERFPNLAETFNITKRRGFSIALTVQPFFSTQSANYVQGLAKGLWVVERPRTDTPFPHSSSPSTSPQHGTPALTEYKQWESVAVLDVTREESRIWLRDKVKHMAAKYGVEALYADMGTIFDLPQYYNFSKKLFSADDTKDMFLQTLRSIPHLSTIAVTTAVKLPKPPTFVALSPTESSWEGLRTVIPNMLSIGVAGFPFLIPGSIGGDFFKKENIIEEIPENTNSTLTDISMNITSSADSTNDTSSETGGTDMSSERSTTTISTKTLSNLPDRELYIRWLQLAHFLPVVQYSFLPNEYDDDVVKMALELERMRKKKIYPFLKKAMDETTTGLPIIRPLWMIDSDEHCRQVSDEFAIGEDIIVAPILQPNSTERDIYLPKGIWKDELEEGASTRGPRWLHNYQAKHDQIPYFIKISDTGQNLS